jgi:hypothetical protein
MPIADEVASGRRLSYADVTERLMADFGPRHGLKHVSDVVRDCRTDEHGLLTLIAPEFLEKLARRLLNDQPAVVLESTP